MTDKRVIIDGVDVSGCILRRRKEPNCTVCNGYSSKVFEFDCSDFKNCYFKQLFRKTQECETLASQLDFEVQKKECLEQECEELKKQLILFMDGEYCANGCSLKQQFNQLKAENDELKKQHQAD